MTKTLDPEFATEPPDLYRWSGEQAAHLRAGRFDRVDAAAVADEIDDVGHVEYDKLESALSVLLQHILKWEHQPQRRTRSWEMTIDEQRARVAKQLRRNPSLRAKLDAMLPDAFASARRRAYAETDLPRQTFPLACPYAWAEITDRLFTLDPE